MEEWKRVVINGEPWDYEVSNLGNVKRIGSSKCLKPSYNHGYLQVILCKNGITKKMFVHRLVATAFISNPENYPVVNHRDECKNNNCVENLEWCTHKYNANYGTRNERASEKRKGDKNPRARKVICLETKQTFGCVKDAQEWCRGNVQQCCQGKAKTAGGYHWQYYDDYKRQLRMNTDINNSRLAA